MQLNFGKGRLMEQAKWIWGQKFATKNSTARFRKAFVLNEAPMSALLSVSAHHNFKMLVNGVPVGGLVSPAPSIFQKRKLFVRHEIGNLLRPGANALAFTVLYLGGDGQNRTGGCAGLIFELKMTMPGGERIIVSSGEDCRTSDISEYVPDLPMRERRGLTGSTLVDLSRIEPDWALPGFDDSAWDHAVISPAQYLVPQLDLQGIPEGAVSRIWQPQCIHRREGFWLFDAGEVLTGFVRLRFRAPKGTLIRLRYGELLDGARKTWQTKDAKNLEIKMQVERSAVNDVSEYYMDEYVAQGEGEETWAEDFSYRAFQFFELSGEGIELTSVEVCKAGTDAHCAGAFACDADIPTWLAEACVRTQKNAIIGTLVDCPHREQAQYIADSLRQTHLLFYNFPDAPALVRKVLCDFADAQLAEGYFPFNSPLDWAPGMLRLRMPEYDLMYATLLRDLHLYSGDKASVEKYYPVATKALAYYLSLRHPNGLMPRQKEETMHIQDWPYSEIDDAGDYWFMFNAYLLQMLKDTEVLARLLGYEQDARHWDQEATRLRAAIIDGFYDEQTGLFKDTRDSEKRNAAVQVMAYKLNLFDSAQKQWVLGWLVQAPFETRVIMSWDYLNILFSEGYKQQAYQMLVDPKVRWGRMMAEGWRTIWEGFEDIESHTHAWNAYPMRLFQQYLLGISCASAGFSKARIEPFFPEGVSELSGSVCTPYGLISLRAKRSKSRAEFEIEVPGGVTGSFSYQGEDRELMAGRHSISVEF